MSNLKTLIIEDDVNSARVLRHLLAKEKITDVVIINVAQLEAHIETNPDLVFVDLEMPHMNGYEVLEALQNVPHYQTVPIVASSVYTSEINQVREAGFHSFIGKPLAKEKFPEQLQRILSGERVWETEWYSRMALSNHT